MPKEIAGKTYYSVPEAAKTLGVSRMTVYRWTVSGRFQEVLQDKTSGHYYIAEESIKTLMGARFDSLTSGAPDADPCPSEQKAQEAPHPEVKNELLSQSLERSQGSPAMVQRNPRPSRISQERGEMARGELPREVARRIIDTVGGSGTPPEYGFQYFTVGLDDYLQVLEGEYLADYIQQGGSCFKLVVGIYGGGKTHFLYCVRERAWRHRFVVSYVTLSPEQTPLHKLELVYRAVALNLTRPLTAAELQSGYEQGIESLVQSWYAQKRAELEHAGFSGDELAEALRSYAATIRGFESVSFARAMQGAFLALLERRDEDFDTLMQWLKGEGYVRSLHGKLGILQRIDRSTAFSMLRSLLQWVRFLGYAGLVILMDEAERVPSLSSRQRELLLHNLRELIDACAQVHFKHTLCLYAVPDETFLEGRAQIYEALRQRLATTFDVINPTGVKIDLEKAGSDAVATLEAIGHKLAAIYAVAYDTSLDSAHLSATTSEIAQAAYEHRYGEAGYKRLFVQRLVQALHLLRIRGGPVSARDVGLEST